MTIRRHGVSYFVRLPRLLIGRCCETLFLSYLRRGRMERGHRSVDRFFNFAVVASQAFGILVIVLVAIWMSVFRGGFAWTSNPSLEFNYHPVLMTIGLIFLYAEAILVYRVFASFPKRIVKIAHGVIQAISIVFALIGLKAVLDSHNLNPKPIPNFYSLHSWLGLLTIGLFALQLIAGFSIFGWPGGTDAFKKFYMNSHRYFGIGIFILACATALTGTVEKTIFSLKGEYGKLPSEAYVINFFGLTIVVFACFVVFIATKTEWKRPSEAPLPEHEALLEGE